MSEFHKALEQLNQKVNETFGEPIVICIDGLHEEFNAVFLTPEDVERAARRQRVDEHRIGRVEGRKSSYQIEILNSDLIGRCIKPDTSVHARGGIYRVTSAEPPGPHKTVFNLRDTGERL